MKFLLLTALLIVGILRLDASLPSLHLAGFKPPAVRFSKDPQSLKYLAQMAASLHDLDPTVFSRQIAQESGFNADAKSRAGAQGVAQIMPGTARSWGVDPREPGQALNAAAKNMARYVRTYRAQGHDARTATRMALAAYNAGPGAVSRHKGVPPYAETRHYVKVIMAE